VVNDQLLEKVMPPARFELTTPGLGIMTRVSFGCLSVPNIPNNQVLGNPASLSVPPLLSQYGHFVDTYAVSPKGIAARPPGGMR